MTIQMFIPEVRMETYQEPIITELQKDENQVFEVEGREWSLSCINHLWPDKWEGVHVKSFKERKSSDRRTLPRPFDYKWG